MIRVSRPSTQSPRTKPQRPEPKVFGKMGENGVSTPHVLSMKLYAHITIKHAKQGHLLTSCHVMS